jgi:hypothetical protein
VETFDVLNLFLLSDDDLASHLKDHYKLHQLLTWKKVHLEAWLELVHLIAVDTILMCQCQQLALKVVHHLLFLQTVLINNHFLAIHISSLLLCISNLDLQMSYDFRMSHN